MIYQLNIVILPIKKIKRYNIAVLLREILKPQIKATGSLVLNLK